MNYKNLIVFDFETASPNPDDCQIIQIAASAVSDRTLQRIGFFSSFVRPDTNAPGYTEDTMEWHAGQQGVSVKQFKEKIMAAPPIDIVWPKFAAFANSFNKSANNSPYTASIPCGYNIRTFDMSITNRMCQQFGPIDKKRGVQSMFSSVFLFDLMDHMWFWTENLDDAEIKTSLKFSEAILPWLGVSPERLSKSHDARCDVFYSEALMVKLFGAGRFLTSPKPDDPNNRRRFDMRGALKDVEFKLEP